MPESYKKLGSIAPTDDSEYVLYATPASTQSLVSNITVTNRSSSSASFDVNVYDKSIGIQGNALKNSLFVATQANNTQIAAYSTDLLAWTLTTMPTSAIWKRVVYGNGMFFSTGQTYGRSDIGNNTQIAAYSTDAVTWTRTTMPIEADWIASIYAFNKWIVVSGSNDNAIATSTDLTTWTQGTLPTNILTDQLVYFDNKVISSPGRLDYSTETGTSFRNSQISLSSTDGITWISSTISSLGIYSVAIGNNIIMLSRRSSFTQSGVYISTNGISWTQTTLPISTRTHSLLFGNGKFVNISRISSSPPGPLLYSISTNGITWTQGTSSVNLDYLPEITSIYGKEQFIILPSVYGYSAKISTDGIVWTTRTILENNYSWGDISYAEKSYISPSINNLYKTSAIDANETLILEPGIALSPENSVVVKDNSSGNLTFSTYGVELS